MGDRAVAEEERAHVDELTQAAFGITEIESQTYHLDGCERLKL